MRSSLAKPKEILRVTWLITLVLVIGCGKKTEDSSSQLEVITPQPIETEIELQLSKQSVDCEQGISCPESIAKIVVVDRDKLRFCTGFLVNSETVATSSSCLTEGLRVSNDPKRCSREVHVFFAKSDFRAEKRVGCARLLLASTLNGQDPSLWRNDLAYIELKEPIFRRALYLSRDGFPASRPTSTLWKVDAENDQQGVIRSDTCTSVLNSYVAPLSDSEFSPNVVVSNCTLGEGNLGAPLLNDRGKWLGLVSGPVNQGVLDYVAHSGLLTEDLLPLLQVGNGACIPSLLDGDNVTHRECFRDLGSAEMTRQRASMLSNLATHESTRVRLEKQVNALRPFVQWKLVIVPSPSGGPSTTQVVPVCIRPSGEWLNQFRNRKPPAAYTFYMTIPDWRFAIGFDGKVRLVSRLDSTQNQTISTKFYPKGALSSHTSDFTVRDGNGNTNSYEKVPFCP